MFVEEKNYYCKFGILVLINICAIFSARRSYNLDAFAVLSDYINYLVYKNQTL